MIAERLIHNLVIQPSGLPYYLRWRKARDDYYKACREDDEAGSASLWKYQTELSWPIAGLFPASARAYEEIVDGRLDDWVETLVVGISSITADAASYFILRKVNASLPKNLGLAPRVGVAVIGKLILNAATNGAFNAFDAIKDRQDKLKLPV